MSRRFYNLPPLTSLAALEAAARHLSFKRAAEELNVTPGAISHQVRALETEIGTKLFNRVHRGVELTEAGEHLFRTVRAAFQDISNRTDALRNQTVRSGVTVGATTAMSALWLTPALSQFWREHPDVRVNQVVSDTLEFGAVQPELVISYGAHRASNYTGTPLFRDTLRPVCAPALAERHAPRSIEDLAAMPLIHLDAPDRRWTSWALWFEEQGYNGPLRRGIVVNNYMIALQAAEDGSGHGSGLATAGGTPSEQPAVASHRALRGSRPDFVLSVTLCGLGRRPGHRQPGGADHEGGAIR